MKFTQFAQEAKRTLPNLKSVLLNSLHMTTGIMTEIPELVLAIVKNDKVNIAEEVADSLWYAANYAYVNDLAFSYEFSAERRILSFSGIENIGEELNTDGCMLLFAGELLDLDKKLLAYNKTRDLGYQRRMLTGFLDSVNNLAIEFGIDLEQAMENNIAKLRVRYPEKFDTELAINRNTDRERVELEK